MVQKNLLGFAYNRKDAVKALVSIISLKNFFMTIQQLVGKLILSKSPISPNTTYSDLPGIYALFFTGDKFLIEGCKLREHGIIYIGKTLRSQKSRNAQTHFKTGRTGSSTVRKSIGALLSQYEEMIPVIRSQSDVEKNRKSHFKFDDASEEKITKWMKENLAVSFFEYPESPEKIEVLESLLIRFVEPVLNLTNEFNNPYKPLIQKLRKEKGERAFLSESRETIRENDILEKPKLVDRSIFSTSRSKNKYVSIWEHYLPQIQKGIHEGKLSMLLDKAAFFKAGERRSYSFLIKFKDNRVINNIGGSAVARDLVKVLEEKHVHVGNKVIRMGKDFILELY